MKLKQLDEKIQICGQIEPSDVKEIAALGFIGIICNRPDGEADDQPDFDDIEDEAERYGLSASYIPYLNGLLTPKLLAKLTNAIDAVDGPVLMYCRSGRRCMILWDAVRGPLVLAAG
ncbi:MAG: TIGR01244 family phosphatase [Rhodobacteraceae bacterium]|nr:TIGR01244 family phosphatase [Paracoccaceae bacterium]